VSLWLVGVLDTKQLMCGRDVKDELDVRPEDSGFPQAALLVLSS